MRVLAIAGGMLMLLGMAMPFLLAATFTNEGLGFIKVLFKFLEAIFTHPGAALTIYFWGMMLSGGIFVFVVGLILLLAGLLAGRKAAEPRVVFVQQAAPKVVYVDRETGRPVATPRQLQPTPDEQGWQPPEN
jgi:hypothetical protein